MRKYLVTGLAAVAISGMFTSCTHETGSASDSANLGVVETYEQAFLNRFGTPSPEADWGFGPSTTQAGTRANTRTIQPEHNFANDAIAKPTTTEMASTNFLTKISDIPGEILSYQQVCQKIQEDNNWNYTPDEFSTGNCYIDANYTGKVKIWSGNSIMYIEGNHDFTNGRTWDVGANMTIYLLEGATLRISNGLQSGSKIYIANDATFSVENAISTGDVSYYNNGGTIEAKSSMVVNGGHEVFCEGGTFKVGGKFQLQNANFYGHNTTVDIDGDIDAGQAWDNSINGNVPGIYYQEGGSFADTNDKLVCNSGKFYTNVNTKFTYIEANGTGVIYNAANATMTSTGQIKLTNGSSIMINDGDLVGTYLGTEGSALFQNNGNTTISGDTRVDSNSNTWVNNGHYTTNNFIYRALSDNVINNCHLKVNNLFSIQLGSTWPLDYESIKTKGFRMDANCGVETKDFEFMGPGFIHMGSNSVFKVSGTAYMGITNDIYGIYGPVSGDYAVFQAGSIVRGNNIDVNQGFVANYYKHLYVVTDSHFNFGWSNISKDQWEGHVEGEGDQPYYRLADGAALYTGTEKPSITITPTNCNPGFTGGGGDTPTPEPEPEPEPDPEPFEAVVRVIAEDMGDQNLNENSDFDFNDVVFDVTYVEEGKVRIKILAAGGTLPLTVGWNGTGDYNTHEVHYMLGYSESTMINTHSKVGYRQDGVKPYEFDYTGTFRKASFKQDVRDNIPVKVRKNGTWYNINADQGRAPGKLCVGTDYTWCDERQDIDSKWKNDKGGLFLQYVKNPNLLTSYWYRQADR